MIDILVFLPDLLDGIFGMLSDTMSVLVLQKPGEEKQSHTTPTLQKQQSIAAAAAASLSGGSKPPSSRADWQPQEIRNMAADVLAQLLGYISEEGKAAL